MAADTLVVDVAWQELPRELTGPDELADRLGAGLWGCAGIATVDEHRLAMLVSRPADVEVFATDLADHLSMIGMPDQTFISWRDELGIHRRCVTGRRVALTHRHLT